MPHSAINCKRLVSKCAWGFWTNAHESEAAEDDCLLLRWIETTTDLAKCTSCRTCKRKFSQDHTSPVTEQREYLVFIHIHLVGPARGTSHRIMPGQLLNRQRISSSSTYISSDLQEELLTRSCQRSYWTDRGSSLHPRTSLRTFKRNFKQPDHASSVTEQTEDLVFIHIHLIGPARGTSHRIMPAQLLNMQTKDLILIHIQGMDSRKTFKVFLIMTLNNVHWCN